MLYFDLNEIANLTGFRVYSDTTPYPAPLCTGTSEHENVIRTMHSCNPATANTEEQVFLFVPLVS